jgi:mRNA-degrading endonuclease RelE of RelBE toxin-antitoxin system
MYEIVIEQKAQRYLKRLPDNIRKRIVKVIRGLSSNPRSGNCKKIKKFETLQD